MTHATQPSPDQGFRHRRQRSRRRPVYNYRPRNKARRLADQVTEHPGACHILAPWNWTDETANADWDTMLKHLPPCRLEEELGQSKPYLHLRLASRLRQGV